MRSTKIADSEQSYMVNLLSMKKLKISKKQ
ncbi:hypothetical protein NEOC95_002305 [Neochlamydia sp. AcF95]|nr:hypothetical protein [Neochlamydia sp. AcF95]